MCQIVQFISEQILSTTPFGWYKTVFYPYAWGNHPCDRSWLKDSFQLWNHKRGWEGKVIDYLTTDHLHLSRHGSVLDSVSFICEVEPCNSYEYRHAPILVFLHLANFFFPNLSGHRQFLMFHWNWYEAYQSLLTYFFLL